MRVNKYGGSPRNARCRVSYEGKKPTVSFSYPSKKHGVEGSMFMTIFLAWIAFVSLSFYVAGAYNGLKSFSNGISTEHPLTQLQCEQRVNDYLENNKTQLINKVCKPLSNIFITMSDNMYQKLPVFEHHSLREILKQLFWPIAFILYIWAPPFVIYYLFRKQWNKLYPKWQAFGKEKKIRIFKPSDIKYSKLNGYFCEIPVFNNVILDYETKGDFSRQLSTIEIEEHKFKYFVSRATSLKNYKRGEKRRAERMKRREDRRKRRQLNEWLWYARFYFRHKPESGDLWVLFK